MSMKKKIAGGSRGGGLWRRVRFVSNGLQSDEYAAVLKNADVVLDTYPVRPCDSRGDDIKRHTLAIANLTLVRSLQFGSFISSMEALSLGTPVVTLGRRQRKAGGRLLKAFYVWAGMNEEGISDIKCCNAESVKDYVRISKRLATDDKWRRRVVSKVKETLQTKGEATDGGSNDNEEAYYRSISAFIMESSSVNKNV